MLASVGTVAVAGCTSVGTSGAGLPEDCPKTQGLDVQWPGEIDASAVEAFVEAYENRYYRDVVVEYEPESRVDSYDLTGNVDGGPTEVDDGYEVAFSGGGGIYTPTLRMKARVSDPPDGVDLVPASEFDDGALNQTLVEADETGEADLHVDSPGYEVDRYIERLVALSDDFEPLSEPGDSDILYVDVDGTTVELSVSATRFHGDYGWNAWYYVDEHVVRRTTDEKTEPRNGKLLECRNPD